MKANEFVKKFGWEEARKACSGVFSGEVVYKRENINIDDLKHLVESYELVIVWRMPSSWADGYDGDVDGIEGAKMYLEMFGNHELVGEKLERFKQAIADVESCQFKSAFEDDRTDFVSDIANHISPTTVVIER